MPDLSGSLSEIETRLEGRVLAWLGGIALVLGAIFFLSLAFTRGWIGPELRVLIGLGAGAGFMAAGAAFLSRGNRLLGLVLTPVGLAVFSLSLFAATTQYGLVSPQVGLAGALASAIAAAVIAVRWNSQTVAIYGLIAVLAAPPILDAPADAIAFLFVAAVLVGTTGVALWRSWPWLPPVAFVLSAPQVAAWIAGDPAVGIGVAGVALFWLLNIVAAGGEAFRRRRDDLTPSSASLLLANAAFAIWAGFAVLSGGDNVAYRGLFLVLLALAHLGAGGWFVAREGDRNLFGLLCLGTGIAVLTMAAPVQLGASVVPIAWTAEAVALAWLAMKRGHSYSAIVSGVLYVMAGTYLVGLYASPHLTSGTPFLNPAGASLAFFVAGIGAGTWVVRDRALRSGLVSLGLGVSGYAISMTLAPVPVVIGLTALVVIGTAAWRVLPLLPNPPIPWQVEGLIPASVRALVGDGVTARVVLLRSLPGVLVVIGLAATGWLVGPVFGQAGRASGDLPFADPAGLALVVYLVGLVAVALVSGVGDLREPLAAVGLLVIARGCASEFEGVALVAAWAALMVVGLALWRGLTLVRRAPPRLLAQGPALDWTLDLVLPAAAFLSGLLALAHVLAVELPSDSFGSVRPPDVPFTDAGAAAVTILVVATLLCGVIVGGAPARRIAILIAGGIVAYAIPYEVYAWAVSVLWVGLALIALWAVRLDREGRVAYTVACGGLVMVAAAVAICIVAPPARLVVGPNGVTPIVALESAAALLAVAVGLAALARENRDEQWSRLLDIAAGTTLAYLISVAAVDLVASRVGNGVPIKELQTQGEVVLSVTWAVLGVIGYVAGLRRHSEDLRRGGLALLALATIKVFVIDLSSLDVAYRVVSFIVLGLVLLASAWLWQRFMPHSATSPIGHDE
jgi:uncharacterized membrane protein